MTVIAARCGPSPGAQRPRPSAPSRTRPAAAPSRPASSSTKIPRAGSEVATGTKGCPPRENPPSRLGGCNGHQGVPAKGKSSEQARRLQRAPRGARQGKILRAGSEVATGTKGCPPRENPPSRLGGCNGHQGVPAKGKSSEQARRWRRAPRGARRNARSAHPGGINKSMGVRAAGRGGRMHGHAPGATKEGGRVAASASCTQGPGRSSRAHKDQPGEAREARQARQTRQAREAGKQGRQDKAGKEGKTDKEGKEGKKGRQAGQARQAKEAGKPLSGGSGRRRTKSAAGPR